MTVQHDKERTSAPPPAVDAATRRLVEEVLVGQSVVSAARALTVSPSGRAAFPRFDASAEISAQNHELKVRLGVFYDHAAGERLAVLADRRGGGRATQNVHDLFGETANQLVGRIASLIENGSRLSLSQPMTVFWGEDDFTKALAPGRAGAFVQLWRIDGPSVGLKAGLQLAIRGDDGVLDRLSRRDAAPAPKAGVLEFF